MRDNGAPSIWMSCYKQLSLSYQSSGRGGGSPPGASALPPRRRSSARAAVVLVSFVVAARARSSAPRRMCAPRRCAGVGRCAAALAVSPPALVLVGGSCAGGSRLRALRRALHGGYVVEHRYIWSSTARVSFSSATCAAKKILLGLQTCASPALGGRRVRCSQAANPFIKKVALF